ncbi:PREDICTED: FBD-associated F-box protein At4g10400-like [Camelina sativa]|uniref:FBD-associated F-box protein At4g10400-like n=1 Tax=Camelina sativa TaxID=90675 RepID=A0ABM0SL38_CAMSA|nr:PREDICTED: FBD-associated F-box protein At4g10400-like [Camelina sativa]
MDRISGLCDELLIKILLYVPTKVAVSTSILSKRWEYLWMWLPKFDYGSKHYSPSDCEMLQCFLEKNLPLHRAPVIESFRLVCSSEFKAENIKLWVVIAVSRCLRKLKVYYSSYPMKPNILPSNLYTCKSLVILKLEGNILLDVPRMGVLPSLKTLQLKRVIYFNEESLQRLLSNCPVLEDLLVDLREVDNMGKLTVVVPSLQSLSLYIPYNFDIDEIEIRTPFLKYFKLEDCNDKSHYCLVENMPNLMEAYVEVGLDNIKSLIGSITSVKRLSICISSKAMYDEGFVFNQLEHLKICFGEFSSNLLVRLLKDSSNLQVLDLSEMDDHCHEDMMVNWIQPSTVPECMLLSLQTLKWWGYIGTPGERDVAVYILKNVVHLKTMTVTSFEVEVPKFEMIKELALSSRASTACQLVFNCR